MPDMRCDNCGAGAGWCPADQAGTACGMPGCDGHLEGGSPLACINLDVDEAITAIRTARESLAFHYFDKKGATVEAHDVQNMAQGVRELSIVLGDLLADLERMSMRREGRPLGKVLL